MDVHERYTTNNDNYYWTNNPIWTTWHSCGCGQLLGGGCGQLLGGGGTREEGNSPLETKSSTTCVRVEGGGGGGKGEGWRGGGRVGLGLAVQCVHWAHTSLSRSTVTSVTSYLNPVASSLAPSMCKCLQESQQ